MIEDTKGQGHPGAAACGPIAVVLQVERLFLLRA